MSKDEEILKLKGGNLDIDLLPNSKATWSQDGCPWNLDEQTDLHRCAVKNESICKYFRGIEPLDTIRCAYRSQAREKAV